MSVYVDKGSRRFLIPGVNHTQFSRSPGNHKECRQFLDNKGHQLTQFKNAQFIAVFPDHRRRLPLEHGKRHLDAGSKSVRLPFHPLCIVIIGAFYTADHFTLDLGRIFVI